MVNNVLVSLNFQPPWDLEIGKKFIIHYTYGCDYNLKVCVALPLFVDYCYEFVLISTMLKFGHAFGLAITESHLLLPLCFLFCTKLMEYR